MTDQDRRYASGCFAFYFLWVFWAVIVISAVSLIPKISSALFPKSGDGVGTIIWLVGIFGFVRLLNMADQYLQNKWLFYRHLHEMVKDYQQQNEHAQQRKFSSFGQIFRSKKNEK